MFSGMDRAVINMAVAVLAFVGISSSISPWLDELYGEITVWTLILMLGIGGIIYVLKSFDIARVVDREVKASWKENGEAVRRLEEQHAAHPEVARELRESMEAEKEAAGATQPSKRPTRGA